MCVVEVYKPDVIGITESWANSEILDSELSITGYDLFRKDRGGEHRGGGVLLYTRCELRAGIYEPKTAFPEHIWCKVPNKTGRELLIGVCYRTTNLEIYKDDINGPLRELMMEVSNNHILMMGDYNYGDIDWSCPSKQPSCEDSRLFLECVEDCFFTQHVMEPTRSNSNTILDLVFTDEPEMVDEVEILGNFATSDHHMLLWKTEICAPRNDSQATTKDYRKADLDGIHEALQAVDWDTVLRGGVEECWHGFKETLQTVVGRFVPDRRVGAGKYKKAIWMTQKAVDSVKRKHNVFRKCKDTNDPRYVQAAKQARQDVRNAKRSFEQKLADNIKQDNKSFFAYARSRSAVATSIGPLVNATGELQTTPEDISEELNRYFASVFTKEMTNLPDVDKNYRKQSLRLDNVVMDESVVMEKLMKLRADKATGADDISPRLLVEIRQEICHPLTIIFQKSLDTGCVPSDWKLANVSPIFKKGCRSQSGNYRPVSLTSQICKIHESILRDALVDYLEKNALLHECQHGFRRGRSCLTNLLIFLDKVTRAVDEGDDVDIIYLDFAKAFDKVPHQRLVMKMQNIGIDGRLLGWIKEWLSERKQRVCVKGVKSGWREVTSGVPQGSVLGPVLFLIFINDIDEKLLSWILTFADDTKLSGTVRDERQRESLQKDLTTLENWSKTWQMEFNTAKCKVLHVGRTNKEFQYFMNGQPLDAIREEKDLGIIISDDLKSSRNCQAAYSRANRMLGMIRRTITLKSSRILVPLYKALVRPLVEYCTPAWSPHYQKDKNLIEKIQHRFTKMIPDLHHLPYTERLNRLNMWTLEERRNRSDLIEMFRIQKGLSGIKSGEMFELVADGRTRGHSLKIRKNRCNLDLRKYFFSERVVSRWNALREEDIRVDSLNSFKNRLTLIRKSRKGFFTDT